MEKTERVTLKKFAPKIAAEADGWDPATVTAKSGQRMAWKCRKGHQWEARIRSRTVRGHGCPMCAGRRASAENNLQAANPGIAAEAHGWDPTSVTPQSNKAMTWRCSKGHEWVERVDNRFKSGAPCAVCVPRAKGPKKTSASSTAGEGSVRRVRPGRELSTVNPVIAAEADGWDPATVNAGSNARLSWRCAEGHQWEAQVRHRNSGSGCPMCAKTGFDPSKPSVLYVLAGSPDGVDSIKVGISCNPKHRFKLLKDHAFDVNQPLLLLRFEDGVGAREVEKQILTVIRSLQPKSCTDHGVMFHGSSETFPASEWTPAMSRALLKGVTEALQDGRCVRENGSVRRLKAALAQIRVQTGSSKSAKKAA